MTVLIYVELCVATGGIDFLALVYIKLCASSRARDVLGLGDMELRASTGTRYATIANEISSLHISSPYISIVG